MKSTIVLNRKIKQQLIGAIRQHLPSDKYHVFVFGSRALRTNMEKSDIDVGIIGPEPVPASNMSGIRQALDDLPIFYPVEVVDFSTVSEDFRKIALRKIEYLS